VVLVRLDDVHRWSLNDTHDLSDRQLTALLSSDLCRRVEKVVFFSAATELSFGDVAQGIDTVQGVCAPVLVLLTPSTESVHKSQLRLPSYPL
jgi:hypothetical protein